MYRKQTCTYSKECFGGLKLSRPQEVQRDGTLQRGFGLCRREQRVVRVGQWIHEFLKEVNYELDIKYAG